jgi:hypothetical protein
MKFAREEKPLTPAQIIFKDKQILVERPEGMDFQSYKILQKHQTRILKKLLR